MFTIHDTAPESMEKSPRIDWPFKSLEVGQAVEISREDHEIFKKARVAAHALAAYNGWKFSTKIGENGSLYVERVE